MSFCVKLVRLGWNLYVMNWRWRLWRRGALNQQRATLGVLAASLQGGGRHRHLDSPPRPPFFVSSGPFESTYAACLANNPRLQCKSRGNNLNPNRPVQAYKLQFEPCRVEPRCTRYHSLILSLHGQRTESEHYCLPVISLSAKFKRAFVLLQVVVEIVALSGISLKAE